MLATHNSDPSCVLTGSSTHNERIERLWRDMYQSVSSNFVAVFTVPESEELLDTLNEVDMYCLHIPRINKCLAEFQQGWNHHSLSTEGSKSPYQLFLEGICAENRDCSGRISDVEQSAIDNLNASEV